MFTTVATEDGPFTIIAGPEYVLASGWTEDREALEALIHPQLVEQATLPGAEEVLDQAMAAVQAYYQGDFASVAEVPVVQRSGPYREHAWRILREIAPGEPVTYGEYAQRTGNVAAVRAAAGACAHNAAALFVPCHRVIRTDGSFGGFRYGSDTKRSLLEREGFALSPLKRVSR